MDGPKSRWNAHELIQAGLFALSIIGALGVVGGTYVTTSVRLAEYDIRIASLEHAREDALKSEQAYRDEMRVALARALDLLTDVRLQIAKTGKHE